MIRRLFVYFTIVLTLCFIISCKKDSPSVNSTKTEHKKASVNKEDEDLVIRDDTASIKDTVGQDKQQQLPDDSVSDETQNNNDSEHITQSDTRVYDIAETLPEFPGGLQSLNKYISEHTGNILGSVSIKHPVRSMVSFIVEKDGSLSGVHLARSTGNSELDDAALKIVQGMPVWSPARNDGINVRMKYTVPVIFNPQN